MAYELEPGERCRLPGSYGVDGRRAFAPAAEVIIEAVDPDRERPGFKYVVFSARLGKHIRLRGMDLQRLYCKRCGADLDPDQLKCTHCGWIPAEKSYKAVRIEPEARSGPGNSGPFL